MQKRGYFFTLDVLIAMIVMVVGFMLIWSSMGTKTSVTQPYFLAQDLIDFMSTTTVADMTSIEYVRNLTDDGNITKAQLETTVLEQIAFFYYENHTLHKPDFVLKNFTRVILENATPTQYSFEFLLGEMGFEDVIYSQKNPFNKVQNDSDSLVSAKTIISVVIDKTTISDPMVAEVRVWQ